ncbi:acyl dehydratase [Aliidiomarina taiwanensis]|uniref:Acyl dehydratase n=2 Tax=Aliidiomarina taiwanensis TaxID=946228 RepID=A0A432X9T3_9GAMM|nr:acyl dehydratase [Aliidiomarina taiwanensis]
MEGWMAQGYQAENPPVKTLPDLPGMLLRAVGTVTRKGIVSDDLKRLTSQYSAKPIDLEHLASYKEKIPNFVSDVPLTYFYLLAQRAHLALMLENDFPFPILGMVHVANRMEYFAPVDKKQPFTLDVQIEMPARAAKRKRIRPMYLVDFYQDDTLVLRSSSAYQVGGGSKPGKGRERKSPTIDLSLWQENDAWSLPSHLGRTYARLSGDYNPIHLHPWVSRWFGFSRPIIHGMYSVARAQASIEHYLGEEVTLMDVGFRRPVFLPTELKSFHQLEEGRLMVADTRGSRSFLEGSFETRSMHSNKED